MTQVNDERMPANPIIESMSLMTKFARKQVLQSLSGVTIGQLIVHESGSFHEFGKTVSSQLDEGDTEQEVHLYITDNRAWKEILLGGTNGAGEAYMKGYWYCSDLVALVRLFIQNADLMGQVDQRWTLLKQSFNRVLHWLSRNTKLGSRKNIAAHYDLGNEFFELFLDPSMMYSSAFYPNQTSSLEQAATAKLDRICQKLELKPSDRIVEIGTGWGGFAIHAARHYGCHVTTTTISKAQHEEALNRVVEAGLQDKIDLRLDDYRDLEGQYDKLVSIEMIEAVGHQFLDTYIEKCSHLLKPNGLMCIQAITIRDQQYEQAKHEVDFIKKHIFPGGFLPSVTAIGSSLTRVSDLQITHIEDIGLHYAQTLSDWRRRFMENIETVKAQGYSSVFRRMWEFYLCYCEGSFRENYISTVQLIACKPKAKVPLFTGKL